MRIAILTDGIHPFVIGGMQKHSHYLVKFLVRRGHEVTLVHCVPNGSKVPTSDETRAALEIGAEGKLEVLGFVFPKAGVAPGHYLKESYLFSRNVFNALKEKWSSFDFIYAKGFSAWHLLHEKSKGFPCAPVGVKFHGYEMFQPTTSVKSRLQYWLLRNPVKWNNRHADFVFSYGGKITGIIASLGVEPGKIIEIPTGIEEDWLRKDVVKPTDDVLHFLFIGRSERRKGIRELMQVLQQLSRSESFHFHFIGPIPHSLRVKSASITYHGQLTSREEIQSVMAHSQVLVTPSHSEGMPNVILEGMSQGLSVIATNVGAVSAMVNDSNGWLIPPFERNALHDAMISAIRLDPKQMRQKQQSSLERVRSHFLWEDVAVITEKEIMARVKSVGPPKA